MNLNDKNLMTLAIVVCVALFLSFAIVGVGSKFIVKKTTESVIENLRKDYTPGPYNPGYDPDKVDPSFFQGNGDPRLAPSQVSTSGEESPWQDKWTVLRN